MAHLRGRSSSRGPGGLGRSWWARNPQYILAAAFLCAGLLILRAELGHGGLPELLDPVIHEATAWGTYGLSVRDLPERGAGLWQEGPSAAQQSAALQHTASLIESYDRVRQSTGILEMEFDNHRHRHAAAFEWEAFVRESPPAGNGTYAGRGVVLIGGGKYTLTSLVAVSFLRGSGCTLPVEMWFPKDEMPMDSTVTWLTESGVHVRSFGELDDAFRSANVTVDGFALKALAVVASSFAETVYLDSDVMFLEDPASLFDTTLFSQTGMILWPDFWHQPPGDPGVKAMAAVFGFSRDEVLTWANGTYGAMRLDPYRDDQPVYSGNVRERKCWDGSPRVMSDPAFYALAMGRREEPLGCGREVRGGPLQYTEDKTLFSDELRKNIGRFNYKFEINSNKNAVPFTHQQAATALAARLDLPTHDSCVMLLDKQRHDTALRLFLYLNLRGSLFHRLLTPNGNGVGDKETLPTAMRALHRPYHLVDMPPGGAGTVQGLHTMVHFAPESDRVFFLHRNCRKWEPDSPGIATRLTDARRVWDIFAMSDPRQGQTEVPEAPQGWQCAVGLPPSSQLIRRFARLLPFDVEATGALYAREIINTCPEAAKRYEMVKPRPTTPPSTSAPADSTGRPARDPPP
ncbi:unnamed protein product [Pedinophyceae sp. YPF-701]|nr:unnamed protein product [Pedinophyceae sp. YPF-701]